MPSEVKQLVIQAQAAEVRGDKSAAITLLRRAAEAFRELDNATQALRMLRHARRLEGISEPDPDLVPAGPLSEAPSVWSVGDAGSAPAPGSAQEDAWALSEQVTEVRRRVLEERAAMLSDPSVAAWCSFCCRPDREVGRLVAGPAGAYVCAACVELAQRLLGLGPASSVRPSSVHPSADGPSFDRTPSARVSVDGSSEVASFPGTSGPASSQRASSRAAGPGAAALDASDLALAAPASNGTPLRRLPLLKPEASAAPAFQGRVVIAAHLRAAAERLTERAPRLTLIVGAEGTGKSALLAALPSDAGLLKVDVEKVASAQLELEVAAHLARSPAHRATVAVRGERPVASLTLDGPQGPEPLYETAALAAATDGALSLRLLEAVDAVVALEPFGDEALAGLLDALVDARGASIPVASRPQLVAIARKAARPLSELVALVGRLPRAMR